MKKILVYNGSLRMGGLERILVEVLQNIDRKKYKIDLFITNGDKETNFFEKDIPEDIKINYLVSAETKKKLDLYRKRKKKIYYKFLYNYMMFKEKREKKKNILGKISSEHYDVVIDFDMGLSKDIELINADKKIAWVHSSIKSNLIKHDKIERLGRRLKKYDYIVNICDDMKKETESLYPFLKNKLVRIFNPFNFERIQELSYDKNFLTSDQKNRLNEKYCVAVSRLDLVQKDFETLLKAFEILKDRKISDKLYIVGDGPGRKQIEKWIDKMELNDTVYLVGLSKNPYVWMKNAEIFIHSSRYEGLPTVLIEAMACGIPVVSTDCPTGPREILENGKSGILVPVGDALKIADSVEKLLNKNKFKSEILINADKRIQEFDKKRVIEEIQNLIEEK